MKKLLIIAVAIACSLQFVSAQTTETGVADYTPTNLRYNFFTNLGTVRLETQEMSDAADTLVTLMHRSDDIVWSRVVYRIVDLRQKQNYRLYYPYQYENNNPTYRNLLLVLAEALCDTVNQAKHPLHMYSYNRTDFKPVFTEDKLMTNQMLQNVFRIPAEDEEDQSEEDLEGGDYVEHFDNGVQSIYAFNPDSVSLYVDIDNFQTFCRNQVKWCIQEVYYFDKHTSRLHQQIIAIAPMYPEIKNREVSKASSPFDALIKEVIGWVPYEEFRYYMARQNMIPDGNSTQRVTFDDFFSQNLYSSYIIGDENMFNRVLLNYATDANTIRKEQECIAKELLDFEQDLWEN